LDFESLGSTRRAFGKIRLLNRTYANTSGDKSSIYSVLGAYVWYYSLSGPNVASYALQAIWSLAKKTNNDDPKVAAIDGSLVVTSS
jgi:hypothetical protein